MLLLSTTGDLSSKASFTNSGPQGARGLTALYPNQLSEPGRTGPAGEPCVPQGARHRTGRLVANFRLFPFRFQSVFLAICVHSWGCGFPLYMEFILFTQTKEMEAADRETVRTVRGPVRNPSG
ncbi:uncharacterized protein Ecym_1213 [Eremothecium cymbalariae DBVPG|uniref:Uncharacterized protein n=1 Tax=Eremothecium cymbalariae (strain CBS 270.75 / DBVPG 7215 / KCTC 17166 / NRRL Y-17582) TaxID=931890 RepID=G8JMZ6_ERECY|nr:hypothetical protein Ecym_1213 [Eremothecium cymbalariae DBVPG\